MNLQPMKVQSTRRSVASAALRLIRVSASALVICCSIAASSWAETSGCEPPKSPSGPAAGEWKGYFRLVYEIHFPGPIEVKVPGKVEGDLDYSLGRAQNDDPPPPPPSRPKTDPTAIKRVERKVPEAEIGYVPPELPEGSRKPARPSGWLDPTAASAAQAKAEAARSDAALNASGNLAEAEYNGLYIRPGKSAQLQGLSNVTVLADINAKSRDMKVDSDVGTEAPVQVEIKGEENPETATFTEIGLWETEGEWGFRVNFTGTTRDGSVSGDAKFKAREGGSGSGTAEAVINGKKRKVGFKFGKPAAESLPPGVDQETESQREAREFDEAYDRLFGPPKSKRQVVTLKVAETDCCTMRGTIDTTELEAAIRSIKGAIFVIKESEWVATLDECDSEFAQRVKALADEPIPTPLTWAYVDNFNARWLALHREGNSDYKRCVLRRLQPKFLQIQVAALQVYVDSFPKPSDNASCVVMNAALQRLLPLIRVLELHELGGCSLIAESWSKVDKAAYDIVKRTLAGKYTASELACIHGASRYVDLGDLAAPLAAAWHEVEVLAAKKD